MTAKPKEGYQELQKILQKWESVQEEQRTTKPRELRELAEEVYQKVTFKDRNKACKNDHHPMEDIPILKAVLKVIKEEVAMVEKVLEIMTNLEESERNITSSTDRQIGKEEKDTAVVQAIELHLWLYLLLRPIFEREDNTEKEYIQRQVTRAHRSPALALSEAHWICKELGYLTGGDVIHPKVIPAYLDYVKATLGNKYEDARLKLGMSVGDACILQEEQIRELRTQLERDITWKIKRRKPANLPEPNDTQQKSMEGTKTFHST